LQAERKALGLTDGQKSVFPDAASASAPSPARVDARLSGLLVDFIGEEGGEGEEGAAVVTSKKTKPVSAGKELLAEMERARARRSGGSGKKKT